MCVSVLLCQTDAVTAILAAILSYSSGPLLSAVMKRVCECVVKYRWQIDRLKILQALLSIFCAKIPFFFCCVLFTSSTLDVIQFLHSTFVYSLNIYASVLVLFSLCISHMVIIDTYIVFDCSLFLLLLFFFFYRHSL